MKTASFFAALTAIALGANAAQAQDLQIPTPPEDTRSYSEMSACDINKAYADAVTPRIIDLDTARPLTEMPTRQTAATAPVLTAAEINTARMLLDDNGSKVMVDAVTNDRCELLVLMGDDVPDAQSSDNVSGAPYAEIYPSLQARLR